jgi:hypothetical protein
VAYSTPFILTLPKPVITPELTTDVVGGEAVESLAVPPSGEGVHATA